MKKKVSLAIVMMTLLLSINAFADNFMPGFPLRWNDVYYYSPAQHNRCDVPCSNALDSFYSNAYSSTLSNWYNNSNDYVCSYNTFPQYSKVDFVTAQTWPSEWGNYCAMTLQYDKYDNCLQTDGVFANDFKIKCAAVVTNKNMNSYVGWAVGADKVLGHELGHCVGLGHPAPGTTSIMTNGQTSWNKPQDHDKNDLDLFY